MRFRFGLFEFDRDTGELRKNGRSLPLERQPARALACLLEHPGELVSRDALRAAVWEPGTHVDFDRGLAYCLGQIRSALGDSADNPRFVKTVPRQGFIFIAPVSVDVPDDGLSGGEPPPQDPQGVVKQRDHPFARTHGRRLAMAAALVAVLGAASLWFAARSPDGHAPVIVAVSVFDNETGLSQHDRLVAGLSDLVVERLSTLAPGQLSVIGNAAVLRQPRNIRNLQAVAAALRADYVLLGQLQRGGADDDLRFITHFIRLEDGTHLRANRLPFVHGDLSHLEDAVVAEFERVTREHALRAAR